MPDPITLDDIYGLFRASQAEADRCTEETDHRLAKLERIAATSRLVLAELSWPAPLSL